MTAIAAHLGVGRSTLYRALDMTNTAAPETEVLLDIAAAPPVPAGQPAGVGSGRRSGR